MTGALRSERAKQRETIRWCRSRAANQSLRSRCQLPGNAKARLGNLNAQTNHTQERESKMEYIPLRNANLQVMGRSRLAFTGIGLAIAILLSGCATAPKPAKAGKLYHVGLVWLKEPGNEEHRQKIIEAAHSFARARFPKCDSSLSAGHCRKQVRGLMPRSTFVSSCGLKIRRRWIVMGRIRFT